MVLEVEVTYAQQNSTTRNYLYIVASSHLDHTFAALLNYICHNIYQQSTFSICHNHKLHKQQNNVSTVMIYKANQSIPTSNEIYKHD